MKIRVLSDLHLNHRPFTYVDRGEDVVVLAGDIHVGVAAVEWAMSIESAVPIIYVPGNHEFEYAAYDELVHDLQHRARHSCVNVLHNQSVVIDRVRFMGGPMWTDMNVFGKSEQWFATKAVRENVSDYKTIVKVEGTKRTQWTTDTLLQQHREFCRWANTELSASRHPADSFDKTVMVTHFAPHFDSVPEKFKRSLTTAYFASDMTRYMQDIDMWVHGHIHTFCDYTLSHTPKNTRVVCNPRGYTTENTWTKFNPDFIVSV